MLPLHGKKSPVRTWLNKTFLKEAFSSEEQKAILQTNVDNSQKQCNSEWAGKGGKNTKDKLFLLSYHEAFEQYFSSKTARLCAPTDYADPKNSILKEMGLQIDDEINNKTCL